MVKGPRCRLPLPGSGLLWPPIAEPLLRKESDLEFPHELILKDVPRKASLEAYVEEKLEKLTPLSDRILSARVTIELPHHHKRKGAHYHVTVELSLPGAELIASRNREDEPGHETMHLALRDAFAAIRRQLLEYVEKRRPTTGTRSEVR